MYNSPFTRSVFRSKELTDYATLLYESGFTIIYREPGEHDRSRPSYFSFERDGHIGYVQEEHGQFSFNTAHKPNTRCGTGFRFAETYKPDVKTAEDCSKCSVPSWATNDLPHVSKYDSLDQFLAAKNQFGNYKIAREVTPKNDTTITDIQTDPRFS